MKNNNIRTMEFMGIDSWDRPVYKCLEDGRLYKDVTLGEDNPELCSCGNDFDGEPDCKIEDGLEIHFKNQVDRKYRFEYMLLDRLRSDCDYYLGYGDRCASTLYWKDEQRQIEEMKVLYNSFPDNKKPIFLTYEQILQYEKQLIQDK